jgi:hypothetical protein
MKNKQQNPAILIRDEGGKPTHALIQDTDSGEKTFYKLESMSFEEIAELLK